MTIVWEEAIPGQTLLRELNGMFRLAAAGDERSQQKALGPSEIGHPCPRRLAMGIMQEPKINVDTDPLPSVTGRAVHTWFEDVLVPFMNNYVGRERWIAERRVFVRDGQSLPGKCDLYDTDTDTVIDLKNPGVTALNKYKKADYPGEQYEVQLQAYGLGYANAGYDVKRVAIYALPRGGFLSDAWVWARPFNPQIALDAIKRIDEITVLAYDLDVEHHPERYKLLPTAASFCEWCPWFSKEPVDGVHCCGDTNGK